MSRHAEPRSSAELADVAAAMPPIPEGRLDGWDPKPWMDRRDQVDAVEDVPPYTRVEIRWTDPVGRQRITRVGEQGGREAVIHADVHTTDLAVVEGHRFLQSVADG